MHVSGLYEKVCIIFIVLFLCSNKKSHSQNNGELQPFAFQATRLIETLESLGAPIAPADKILIEKAITLNDEKKSIAAIQTTLDKYALFDIEINPESRVSVRAGLAKAELWQNGWRTFLIKVNNQAGITAKLHVESQQAKPVYHRIEENNGQGSADRKPTVTAKDITDRWLDMMLYTREPMAAGLSGLPVDYFIIQLYSRDAGKKAAGFSFNAGLATPDIGFRNSTNILFTCKPSSKMTFNVLDENNKPTTASFIIRDKQHNIHPSLAKRLAPDFFFQPQVYRANGEIINLPPGEYNIEYGRGPEYINKTKTIIVAPGEAQNIQFNLERWINPANFGWYSGDHHIHAAGCSHYTSPTEGVNPEDMIRHIKGEAVNVGSVLTWGPGYYHQKQFFEGRDNKLSTRENIMRYDLEISGFPSSHAGHLVLLRLKEQDYPGTKVLEDWPTWTIPVLRWAKAQGAITGYTHSGLGLEVYNDSLPNYEMPRFDGIGANEFIVAVTQNLVDFISTMDTPPTWELNIWYHTLNCGYRTRISGETDFPCMSDQKVAHGRSYVKLDGRLNFDEWAEGLKSGRTYTSEGKSHIMDFKVNETEAGTKESEVKLNAASNITVHAKVAAYLNEAIDSTITKIDLVNNIWAQRPWWNIERARIKNTRKVAVELIVNSKVVTAKYIQADGSVQDIAFDIHIPESSWIALRIMPSSHTNPVFVLVNDKPVRALRKSAEWCLKAVDQCWSQKSPRFSIADRADAEKTYEEARQAFKKILAETKEE